MAKIVVLGAGLNGLSLATLLARDGHAVTVLERDAAEPPATVDDMWNQWERRGVTQFRLPHLMLPRWRALIERELPDAVPELERLGALRFNVVSELPVALTGGSRDGDDDRAILTARRPVLEGALANVAQRSVAVRRGVVISGFVTGRSAVDGVPHVVGVITEAGERIDADLVVDATGRRSPLPTWLEAVGARPPIQHAEESGFVYYARHFRSGDVCTTRPAVRAPLLQDYESLSILTLPADNGTWSVSFIASGADRQLRALRDPRTWNATLAQYPLAAHWSEGDAITEVDVMAKLEDRERRFVIEGVPVVTGVVAVGDSWACTNPSLGRGSSIGMLHACALRDLLREIDVDQSEKLALRWHAVTTEVVLPLYEMTVAYDRHRLREIEAERTGESYDTDDAAWKVNKAMQLAVLHDPDVLRGYLDIVFLRSMPDEVLARPAMFDRIFELGRDAPAHTLPGPTRSELVETLHR